jgi:hypothetical protein
MSILAIPTETGSMRGGSTTFKFTSSKGKLHIVDDYHLRGILKVL